MNPKSIKYIRDDCFKTLDSQIEGLASLKNKSILITGGTGFVGTWIAEMVSSLNDDFHFGIKIYLLARRAELFKLQKPHLAHRHDIELIQTDIRYAYDLPKEINYIIHAASSPDNRTHALNPLETMHTIAEGTSVLLKAAERCEYLNSLLFLSSGLIYGNQPIEMKNIPETYAGSLDSALVSSAYAEAKRFAETLFSAARSQAHLPISIIRPFAFIGPYQRLETPWALNNFLRDALSGNEINVFGDGSEVRSYMYGSDMAYWILKIMAGHFTGKIFNLGSDEEVSLENLAKKISNICPPHPTIKLQSALNRTGTRKRLIPDLSIAKDLLNLNITVNLEDALKKTIEWHKMSLE